MKKNNTMKRAGKVRVSNTLLSMPETKKNLEKMLKNVSSLYEISTISSGKSWVFPNSSTMRLLKKSNSLK